ncbi:MAG: hypothetical protein IPI67_38535 [Myxococcales bacterium]|nr:hypothetical protein [Myxococcales bacterium]
MLDALRSAWSLVGFGALTALVGACDDAPGPELASVAVEVDKPFALELTADGKPTRLWLDYDCHLGGPPFTVTVLVNASGSEQKLENDTLHVRYSVSKKTSHSTEANKGMLLFELPAQPSGSKVRIAGTLRQKPGLVISIGGDAKRDAPRCASMRFWAAS